MTGRGRFTCTKIDAYTTNMTERRNVLNSHEICTCCLNACISSSLEGNKHSMASNGDDNSDGNDDENNFFTRERSMINISF